MSTTRNLPSITSGRRPGRGLLIGWQAAVLAFGLGLLDQGRTRLVLLTVGAILTALTAIPWRGHWPMHWLHTAAELRRRRAGRRMLAGPAWLHRRAGVDDPDRDRPVPTLISQLRVVSAVGRREQRLGVVCDERGWAVLLRVHPTGHERRSGSPLTTSAAFETRLILPRLLRALTQADTELPVVQVVSHRFSATSNDDPRAGECGIWIALRIDADQADQRKAASSIGTVAILLRRAVTRCQDVLEPRGWTATPVGRSEAIALIRELLSLDTFGRSATGVDRPNVSVGSPDLGRSGESTESWRSWSMGGWRQTSLRVQACASDRLNGLLDAADRCTAPAVTTSLTWLGGGEPSGGHLDALIRLAHNDQARLDRACEQIVDTTPAGTRLARTFGANLPSSIAALPLGRTLR